MTLPISFLSIFYYPGAGGSISVTTKPIYQYDRVYSGSNYVYYILSSYDNTRETSLWSNVVTSVSGGDGGSYEWKTDYVATVDSYNMGQTYGAPRRNVSGGYWPISTSNGSRCMHCNTKPYEIGPSVSARGCINRVLSWEYYV